jgi:hypothetical protein
MTDPVVLRCTDKFIEILDTNASSLHVVRLDSVMHVRSSYSHVFLWTNTLNASISFTFKDMGNVGPFINQIIDMLGKEGSFRRVQQDLTSLSEKFEAFKKELEPNLFEQIQQDRVSLSEKFEEFKADLLLAQTQEPVEAPKQPMYPVAHSSPFCEGVIMFISVFLIGLFLLSLSKSAGR